MIAIYHAIPVAHIVAMGAQFWVYSFQNKGFNKNVCLIAGNIVHESVEILINISFARIDRLIYDSSDASAKDEGFFGDLTFGKFIAKAASSFSLTKIVDLVMPATEKLAEMGLPQKAANGLLLITSGLAGVIGTEIPEWFDPSL